MGSEEPMDAGDAVEMMLAGTRAASKFIAGTVRPTLAPRETSMTAEDAVIYGQFIRVDAWLRTLSRCDAPGDFQASVAATRSLLETTIDLVFLVSDPSLAHQLLDWEKSAKFKLAANLRDFYKGGALGDKHRDIIAFADRNQGHVEALRKARGWIDSKNSDKTRHPDRWTDRNLLSDAREADKHCVTFQFEDFYELRYRELCWTAHGSGLAGARSLGSEFPLLHMRALHECCNLAQVAAERCLSHFKVPKADELVEELKTQRVLAKSAVLERVKARARERS